MKSKKGVFFTFIALFMIILIISYVTTKEKYRYRERSSAISMRIKTMNKFIQDFEEDIDRELYIGGYRALISMNAYTRLIQGYVPEFNPIFAEILANGTANGTTMNLMKQETQGADIKSWLVRMNEESSKLNIHINMNVNKIEVIQVSPWEIEIQLNATVNISDQKNLASWNLNKIYKRQFSILGFEDPLYTVGTTDRVTNLINISPYTEFVVAGNPSNLNDHVINSYYLSSIEAPSFLMRFSGNLSASPYGIESMIYPDEIGTQVAIKPRSVIDYIYFGNQTTVGDICNVTGTVSRFRIDAVHESFYEVNELNSTGCS